MNMDGLARHPNVSNDSKKAADDNPIELDCRAVLDYCELEVAGSFLRTGTCVAFFCLPVP